MIYKRNNSKKSGNWRWSSGKLQGPMSSYVPLGGLRRCMPCSWGHDSFFKSNGAMTCSPTKVYRESCLTMELDQIGMFSACKHMHQWNTICANTHKRFLKCIRQWKLELPQVKAVKEFQIETYSIHMHAYSDVHSRLYDMTVTTLWITNSEAPTSSHLGSGREIHIPRSLGMISYYIYIYLFL